MQYLECPSCSATPSIEEWKKHNQLIEVLGIENLPDKFEDIDDFYNFQEESGCRLDCPECGDVNCIEDMQLY